MKELSLFRSAFRRKSFTRNEHFLGTPPVKTLTLFDLTLLGIGGTLGSGLFLLTGHVARDIAGPAVSVSYAVGAIVCIFTALSYAEMSSRFPHSSGGAYVFTYAALGELPAFLVGMCLTLEYGVSSAAIARAWASYLGDTLHHLPNWLTGRNSQICIFAFTLIVAISGIMSIGLHHAKWVINVTTLLYSVSVLVIIGYGAERVTLDNWAPFTPFGIHGIISGAGSVFYAYLGFDEVAVLAGEAVNAIRDVPLAIITTMVFLSTLYIAASMILTGMVRYSALDIAAPFSAAMRFVGRPGVAKLVGACTALGMTNTAIVSFAAQPRLFVAMGQDGLLPKYFATNVNRVSTTCGIPVAVLALIIPSEILFDVISAGTGVAFFCTCIALLVTRVRCHDEDHRQRRHLPDERCSEAMKTIQTFAWRSLATAIAVRLGAMGIIPSWVSSTVLFPLTAIPAVRLMVLKKIFVPIEQEGRPPIFMCPWVPMIPMAGIFASSLLFLQLPVTALITLVILLILTTFAYALFSARNVFVTLQYHEIGDASPNTA